MHTVLVPRTEAAIAAGERRLALLERQARRDALGTSDGQVDAAATRKGVLERFQEEKTLNATLGSLLTLAAENQVQVPSGDYRLVASGASPLERYVLILPARANYLDLRRYLSAARAKFPDLAVEEVVLRREAVSAAGLEAQIRFVVFGRRGGRP